MDNPQSSVSRLHALDGLRGVAAMAVFVWHAADVFWPTLIGSQNPAAGETAGQGIAWLVKLPTGILLNGPLAVSVFFCLSAFVLTRAVTNSRAGTSLVLLRLPRLLPLVACGSLLGFLLLKFQLVSLAALASLNGTTNPHVFAESLVTSPSWLECLQQIFFGVWQTGSANLLYDRVLWTIGTEFQGSMLVIALATCLLPIRSVWLASGLVTFTGVVLLGNDFYYFAGGYTLARLAPGFVSRSVPAPRLVTVASFALVILAAAIHPSFSSHLWLNFNPGRYLSPEVARITVFLGISLTLVVAALRETWFARWLCTHPVQYLGFVSFAFYVVHQPLLYSLGSTLCLRLEPAIGYAAAAWGGTLATLLVAFLVADGLTRFVDRPLYKRARKLVKKCCAAPEGAEPVSQERKQFIQMAGASPWRRAG